MKKVYLLTIVDMSHIEHQFGTVFHSVYQDKRSAKHYMLKDIFEKFENGRIKNLYGINLDNDVYVNNNIMWKIEDVNFINEINYLV